MIIIGLIIFLLVFGKIIDALYKISYQLEDIKNILKDSDD